MFLRHLNATAREHCFSYQLVDLWTLFILSDSCACSTGRLYTFSLPFHATWWDVGQAGWNEAITSAVARTELLDTKASVFFLPSFSQIQTKMKATGQKTTMLILVPPCLNRSRPTLSTSRWKKVSWSLVSFWNWLHTLFPVILKFTYYENWKSFLFQSGIWRAEL